MHHDQSLILCSLKFIFPRNKHDNNWKRSNNQYMYLKLRTGQDLLLQLALDISPRGGRAGQISVIVAIPDTNIM